MREEYLQKLTYRLHYMRKRVAPLKLCPMLPAGHDMFLLHSHSPSRITAYVMGNPDKP